MKRSHNKSSKKISWKIKQPPMRLGKLPHLPPYIVLALIRMRSGDTSEIESVISVCTKNILKWNVIPKNDLEKVWFASQGAYWVWVLNEIISHIETSKVLDNEQKEIIYRLIDLGLPQNAS